MMLFAILAILTACHKIEDDVIDRLELCKYPVDHKIPKTKEVATRGTVFASLCSSSMNIFAEDITTHKCDGDCSYDNCITDISLNLTTSDECMDIVGIIPYKTRFVRLYPGRYWINSPEYMSITEYRDIIRLHNSYNIIIPGSILPSFDVAKYVEHPDLYSFQFYIRIAEGGYGLYDIRTKGVVRVVGSVDGLIDIRDLYSYKYKTSRSQSRRVRGARYVWDPQMTPIENLFTRDIFIIERGKRYLYGVYFHTNVCNKTTPVIENTTFPEQYNDTDPVIIDVVIPETTGNGSVIFVPVYNMTEICCSTDYTELVIWIVTTTVPPLIICIALTLIAATIFILKIVKDEKLKYSI